MINFKDFLTEAAKPVEGEGKKLTHLIHAEDSPIHLGDAGVAHVGNVLDNTDAALRGKKSKMPIKTKIDGAPSLVFGYHPETGQPFVATKSAFNKTPKINYTHEDIDANHGHAPGLAAKLHDALNHVNKILPPARSVGGRYPDQVFQGDLVHSGKKDIKKEEDGKISYQPNTIKYKTDGDNAEGQKALNSKIGIAVHTKYKGRDMASMKATPDISEKDLIEHPDVHQVSTDVNIDPSKYTPDMQRAYKEHIENAKATYGKMMKDPEALNFLNGHNIDLEAHINDTVRKGGKASVEGYLQHLQSKAARETEKVKTEASKQKIADNYNQKMAHIVANKKRLQSVLDLHGHLQKAKNVLVDALDKNSVYDNEAGGQKVGHEGYVVNGDTKLVDRDTFSRINFLQGKMGQQKKPGEQDEKV